MVAIMKNNLERMKNEAKTAANATVNFRNQGGPISGGNFGNNTRGFSRPAVNFGGFNNNHFGDEQLLEGLGDETGNRLF